LTPKERAVAAFELREPDDIVPTFELQFQLADELLGKSHVSQEALDKAGPKERERLLRENAEIYVEEAEALDYSIVALQYGPGGRGQNMIETIREVKRLVGRERLIGIGADGTMSIPNGGEMVDLAVRLCENPEGEKERLEAALNDRIEAVKPLVEAGADTVLMCADYCFNSGPFLSPKMFREFVTPYLTRQCAAFREMGLYTVNHTDGDIMPILDQLVEAGSHALHSLDPMAGVSLKEVKKLVGDKIALCGNVNCAILQTGTVDDTIADSKRALRDGMPGGGFFFTTSNTPFKGMPLENYLAMLDVRKQYGRYDTKRLSVEG